MYTSYQLRTFKYFLFKKDNTRPFLRLVKRDKQKTYYSLHDAANYLRCDPDTLWEAFKQQRRFKGYSLQYIRTTDAEAVYAKLYQYHRFARRRPGMKRPIKVIDVFSDNTVAYPSIKEAAMALEIPEGNIRASISTAEKQRLLYEKYVIVDEQACLDFFTPEVRTRLIESIRAPIVVFDVKRDTLRTFSSLAAYLRIMRIHDKIYSAQRYLRIKGVIGVEQRYYVIRQTPLIKPLNEDELRRHFLYLIKEVLGE